MSLTGVIKFRSINDTLRSSLVQPEIVVDKEKLILNAAKTLRELEGINIGVTHVVCRVTVDVTKEVYEIQLFEGDEIPDDVQPLKTFEFENTFEVIQTLRYPVVKGRPYNGEYWWDPMSDVVFSEVETDNGPLSLTFLKPFMYRSRRGSQFLRNLSLPWTASELLNTRLGEPVTLVADPDLTRMKKPTSRFWGILFFQTQLSEKLKSLEAIDVNIFEVAAFFECKLIVDRVTGLRHPVEISINNAKKVIFPEGIFQYDRIALILKMRGMI